MKFNSDVYNLPVCKMAWSRPVLLRSITPPRLAARPDSCQQGFTKEFAFRTARISLWADLVFQNTVIAMLGIDTIHLK